MSEAAEKLKPLLESLTADERAEVVEYITALNGDEEPDLTPEEWDAEWADEINRRIADAESGQDRFDSSRRSDAPDEGEVRVKAVAWDTPAFQELNDALAASLYPAKLRRLVDNALADIANGSMSHARVRGTPARRCILRTPPYSIVYIETDDAIQIYAFPHHKRRANYWKNRLPMP